MITEAMIEAACAAIGSSHRKWMRVALEAAERVSWQPIETAPKDKTQVDLWVEHWNRDPWMERGARWSGLNWLTWNGNVVEYPDSDHWIRATLWHPIPEPPRPAGR